MQRRAGSRGGGGWNPARRWWGESSLAWECSSSGSGRAVRFGSGKEWPPGGCQLPRRLLLLRLLADLPPSFIDNLRQGVCRGSMQPHITRNGGSGYLKVMKKGPTGPLGAFTYRPASRQQAAARTRLRLPQSQLRGSLDGRSERADTERAVEVALVEWIVWIERPSFEPICLAESPSAMSPRTSTCRSVSAGVSRMGKASPGPSIIARRRSATSALRRNSCCSFKRSKVPPSREAVRAAERVWRSSKAPGRAA